MAPGTKPEGPLLKFWDTCINKGGRRSLVPCSPMLFLFRLTQQDSVVPIQFNKCLCKNLDRTLFSSRESESALPLKEANSSPLPSVPIPLLFTILPPIHNFHIFFCLPGLKSWSPLLSLPSFSRWWSHYPSPLPSAFLVGVCLLS